jgi:carbon-monoxide dehydrogenase medium subunit
VSTLCALGAECLISDGRSRRRLPVDQFVTGAYENALGADELLEAIRVPRLSAQARCGYYKVCRKVGEFALAIGAVLNDRERGQLRLVIGATKGRPIVIPDARKISRGNNTLDQAALADVLDGHGIVDRVDRRQKIAAVERAYALAVNS